MTLDEENANAQGVYAISIVDFPAIQKNFVALGESKPVQLKEMDKEKRLLIGLVLQPDQQIYREESDGTPYFIYYTAPTIERLAANFLKKSNQHNATLQHAVAVDGCYIAQSWIVDDPEKDKTAVYGLNAKKGSWAVVMKVDNNDVWEDWVKTGKVLGFSLEGEFLEGKVTEVDENTSKNLQKQQVTVKKIAPKFRVIVKPVTKNI